MYDFRYTRKGALFRLLIMLLVLAPLAGCGKQEDAQERLPPIAIEQGDECHVCGMLISRFPGPKGEAFVRNSKTPLKFCSTRDMFSFLLQPEAGSNVTQVYVHDMAKTDWDHPSDRAFIDAKKAWYVIGQPLKGAMGPTLASFKNRVDAEEFVERHGGRVLRFKDVTLEELARLSEQNPGETH